MIFITFSSHILIVSFSHISFQTTTRQQAENLHTKIHRKNGLKFIEIQFIKFYFRILVGVFASIPNCKNNKYRKKKLSVCVNVFYTI